MLTWNEKFATGSALLDTQHRMLFVKVNHLESLLDGPPQPKSAYDELINFLGTYAITHFEFEEECMLQYRCPTHGKNKEAHAAFLAKFGEFRNAYIEQGPEIELLRELQRFISDWITNHILAVDIGLRGCVKARSGLP